MWRENVLWEILPYERSYEVAFVFGAVCIEFAFDRLVVMTTQADKLAKARILPFSK